MLKRLVISLLLLLGATSVWAVPQTYYFSDCASGGAGTLANPYCLKPGASATNVSVGYLFDGSGTCAGRTEACAGDTIYLCAGACDGSGSATYQVAGTSWIKPVANMFSPRITIRAYAGETVAASGETNSVSYMVELTPGKGGLNFFDFTLKRATHDIFHADCNNDCGNISFGNMTLKEANSCAWGDTDGVGNNVGCLPDAQGGFIFYMLGLGYDFSVTDSTIRESGGMAIRHILSDGSFGTSRNYNVQWINNHFYNIAQIANIWQTWDWQNNRGATITFRNNYFEGWWGSLGLEQRNKGVTIENNTFNCSTVYDMSFGYTSGSGVPMSECQSAISISEGDYGSARRGGNAGHKIRGNVIYGAHLGANRGSEKTQPGWLQTGISWGDSCMDNALCTGLGEPWCCCISAGTNGVGTGRCNSSAAGGNCANTWMNYGCIANGQAGNQIENNMIWATYDCGTVGSGCSGPANDAQSTGIYINTNSPVLVDFNTVYSNDYGIVVDNSYGSSSIHLLDGNIVSGSVVREVKDDAGATPASEVHRNNIYSGSHAPYSSNGGTTICADVDTLDDLSNVCAAPVYLNVAGGISTWDLHTNSTSPDYNTLVSGPILDIDLDQRPFNTTGSLTPYDRGADEVRPEGLTIEWGQTSTTLGNDLNCGPVGAPDDNATFRPFYHNYGPLAATNVKLVFAWSSDATFVSTTCPSCVNVGDLLTCSVGTVDVVGGAQCEVVLACPSVNPRHALNLGADISSDNRGICATDETILGCGGFPAPSITQGLLP